MTMLLAIAVWIAAIAKRPRGRAAAGGWAMAATLAMLALGLTLKIPAVYDAVGDRSGVRNLGQLVKDGSVVLSAFGTQVVLLHLLHEEPVAAVRARRRALAPVLTLLIMTAGFALAHPSGSLQDLHTELASSGLLEFRSVYLLFLAWAFTDIARLCWRFAALAGDRVLVQGLRLIAAGGCVGLLYVITGALQISAAATHDLGLVDQLQRVDNGLIGLATLLVVVGSTAPALAARLTRTSPGQAERREVPSAHSAALECLWASLTGAVPDVVLAPDEPAPAGAGLYRKVIEIEDARRALRRFRRADVDCAVHKALDAHAVPERDRAAAAEGLALALAIRQVSAGEDGPEPCDSASVLQSGQYEQGSQAPASLESEVEWLSEVARWHLDAALVSAAAHCLPADATEQEPHDRAR